MDRRTFLTAASCGLGLVSSLNQRSLAQPTQIGLASQPIRRLTPPKNGLISVACAISHGTTDIDFVGPEAVFETWHRDPLSNKPAPRFKIFTVSQSLDPVGGWVPDFTFNTVPSPQVVVVPAQIGSPALIEWLRKIYAVATAAPPRPSCPHATVCCTPGTPRACRGVTARPADSAAQPFGTPRCSGIRR